MFDLPILPASSGSYMLQLHISRPQPLMIGRLGWYHLPVGHYFYVGSAHGAGGLQARVGRHLRGDGAPHWHIDYVRAVAEVHEVIYTVADNALECQWSQALALFPHAFIPVSRFGASDCRSRCAAHLIAFPPRADLAEVQSALARITRGPIVCLRVR